MEDYEGDDPDYDPDEGEVGKGFRKLGKKIVNYDKLMKRNVLDVRHLKKGNIFGFPTATVSDGFVSNVNKLVKGEGVSDKDMETLDNSEQQLFHRMKHVTSIGGTFKDTSGIAVMKNRLKLVEDEIQSGNDSAHLLVEAKSILKVLARQNIITKAEKDRYYKQLVAVNN
jgi:ribosomal protein S20